MTGLRELAEAATPGPWEVVGGWVEAVAGSEITPQRVSCMSYCYGGTPEAMEPADAAFIAAVAPQTVLGLLDERDRLEAAIREALAVQPTYWTTRLQEVLRLLSAALEHQPDEQEPK